MGQRVGMRRRGGTARRGFLPFSFVVFNRNLRRIYRWKANEIVYNVCGEQKIGFLAR